MEGKGDAMKVFLVDDSPQIRQKLTELLYELDGVEIIGQASQAVDAIDSILAVKPEAVLLDLHLNGQGNGFEVLERIKQEPTAPKVIVLTNYPNPQYRKRCLQAGADFFFDKSYEFEKVVPVLDKLARQDKPVSSQADDHRLIDIQMMSEPVRTVAYTAQVFRPRLT